jgi:cell division GTPase FtsZ
MSNDFDDIEIPDLPLEAELEGVEDESIEDESGGAVTYAFIGSGQGGGRLAEAFYNIGYKKTICTNTANQDLSKVDIPEEQKILLDAGEQGAGKNMVKGEEAASNAQQEILDLMKKKFGQVDHIMVCVGAGGGSGGGSTLVLVESAKLYLTHLGQPDADKRVGVIMTLPTAGESASPAVSDNAQLLSKTLVGYAKGGLVSPLIFVDNDKIKKMYPKLSVKKFWPTVNATVAGLFHVFNVIVNKPTEYTTFDTADYMSVMRGGGCMIMGVTSVKNLDDTNSVSAALKNNLGKTLLAGGFDLKTASHAAAVVLGGEEILEELDNTAIEEGFDTLAMLTGDAMVHRGVYEDKKPRLNVYTLIGGLAGPDARLADLKKFQKLGGKKKEQKAVKASYGHRLYGE